jgi:hypothetical protein
MTPVPRPVVSTTQAVPNHWIALYGLRFESEGRRVLFGGVRRYTPLLPRIATGFGQNRPV